MKKMKGVFLKLIIAIFCLILTIQMLMQYTPKKYERKNLSALTIVGEELKEEVIITTTFKISSSTVSTTTTKPKKHTTKVIQKDISVEPYWNLTFEEVATNFKINVHAINLTESDLTSTSENFDKLVKKQCSIQFTDIEDHSDCELDMLMKRRQQNLRESCNKMYNNTKLPKWSFYDYYVLEKRKLVWCPVFKAASSNWMENIVMMSSQPRYKIQQFRKEKRYDQPNTLARKLAPLMGESKYKMFIEGEPKPVTFIIVRDPIDRLISAYRDKLEKMMPYYHQQYGVKIVKKYRKEGLKRFGNEYYQGNRSSNSRTVPPGRSGSEPTFWEFTRFVIDGGTRNEHWRPAHKLCSLCAKLIDFDVIIKFENLHQEESYFHRRLGIENFIPKRWINQSKTPKKSQIDIREMYLSVLNKTEICKLTKIYEKDFKLLDYIPPIQDQDLKC